MALVLNQEQEMLRDSALSFLRKNASVTQLRKLRDSWDAHGFSQEFRRRSAHMGYTGILGPEAYGGLGLGLVEAGAVMEAIGRNLTATPFLSTAVLAATLLTRHGSNVQRQTYLPRLAAGELIMTLAVDEATKHQPQRQSLTATPTGTGYRLLV